MKRRIDTRIAVLVGIFLFLCALPWLIPVERAECTNTSRMAHAAADSAYFADFGAQLPEPGYASRWMGDPCTDLRSLLRALLSCLAAAGIFLWLCRCFDRRRPGFQVRWERPLAYFALLGLPTLIFIFFMPAVRMLELVADADLATSNAKRAYKQRHAEILKEQKQEWIACKSQFSCRLRNQSNLGDAYVAMTRNEIPKAMNQALTGVLGDPKFQRGPDSGEEPVPFADQEKLLRQIHEKGGRIPGTAVLITALRKGPDHFPLFALLVELGDPATFRMSKDGSLLEYTVANRNWRAFRLLVDKHGPRFEDPATNLNSLVVAAESIATTRSALGDLIPIRELVSQIGIETSDSRGESLVLWANCHPRGLEALTILGVPTPKKVPGAADILRVAENLFKDGHRTYNTQMLRSSVDYYACSDKIQKLSPPQAYEAAVAAVVRISIVSWAGACIDGIPAKTAAEIPLRQLKQLVVEKPDLGSKLATDSRLFDLAKSWAFFRKRITRRKVDDHQSGSDIRFGSLVRVLYGEVDCRTRHGQDRLQFFKDGTVTWACGNRRGKYKGELTRVSLEIDGKAVKSETTFDGLTESFVVPDHAGSPTRYHELNPICPA